MLKNLKQKGNNMKVLKENDQESRAESQQRIEEEKKQPDQKEPKFEFQ